MKLIDIFFLALKDDLSAPSELSGSTDNLSESKDTKVRFVKTTHVNLQATQHVKVKSITVNVLILKVK